MRRVRILGTVTEPVLLDAQRLRARLVDNGPYAALDVVTVTGSTNTDLVTAADQGAPDRTVLIAEEQRAGRGRLHRTWVSPRGYGLHVSVLLRPLAIQAPALAWLPLITGVALVETVRKMTGLRAVLKWPNDLLLSDGDQWYKAAGILVDGVTTPDGMAVVLGIGVNVHHGPGELPPDTGGLPATSLQAQGAEVDREEFAAELLLALAEVDDQWRRHAGDVLGSGLFDRYQRWCGTLGQQVRVDLGVDDALQGMATQIDPSGRLVVRDIDGTVIPVSAGDVVHLRPASS
jgi:BirA family transcriptional regulator, biotin operon repressor / biotin---[acetyl-CoA-carboxylase] ligase